MLRFSGDCAGNCAGNCAGAEVQRAGAEQGRSRGRAGAEVVGGAEQVQLQSYSGAVVVKILRCKD